MKCARIGQNEYTSNAYNPLSQCKEVNNNMIVSCFKRIYRMARLAFLLVVSVTVFLKLRDDRGWLMSDNYRMLTSLDSSNHREIYKIKYRVISAVEPLFKLGDVGLYGMRTTAL